MTQTHEQTAEDRLKELRVGSEEMGSNLNFDNTVELMKWNLRETKLSLKSLGTSKAELHELRNKFYLNKARYFLRRRTLGERMFGTAIPYILKNLEEAHAKPEDIGYTMEELKLMQANERMHHAEDLVYILQVYGHDQKTRRMCAKQYKESILHILKEEGLTFENIRINKKHFAEICRVALA